MTATVCLISGAGPGTGSALARRFAEGRYHVALLARSEERLAALEKQLPNARGYRCDVSDHAQVNATASAVERDLGNPHVVIHNAVGGAIGKFLEIDPEILETYRKLGIPLREQEALLGVQKGNGDGQEQGADEGDEGATNRNGYGRVAVDAADAPTLRREICDAGASSIEALGGTTKAAGKVEMADLADLADLDHLCPRCCRPPRAITR